MSARRLSHAISEGEGISFVVAVGAPGTAEAAEADGAAAVWIDQAGLLDRVREATALPVLGSGTIAGADAWIVGLDDDLDGSDGIERVIRVEDEESLEDALERFDPELILLAAGDADDPIDCVLGLLSDVPAGKLAIADVGSVSRDQLEQLERAGVDAVLVREPLPAP